MKRPTKDQVNTAKRVLRADYCIRADLEETVTNELGETPEDYFANKEKLDEEVAERMHIYKTKVRKHD